MGLLAGSHVCRSTAITISRPWPSSVIPSQWRRRVLQYSGLLPRPVGHRRRRRALRGAGVGDRVFAMNCFEGTSRCHDPRARQPKTRLLPLARHFLTPAMYQSWRPRRASASRRARWAELCLRRRREPIHGPAKKTSMFFTPPQAEFRPNAPWRNEDFLRVGAG